MAKIKLNHSVSPKLITIVTVTLNAVSDLERTLSSIADQNHELYELIVIDGLSNDGTLQVLEKYKNIISDFVSEPDDGIYDAMNKGLRLARGNWIYFLNAGDVLIDGALEKISDRLGDTGDIVHFNCRVHDNKGHQIPVRRYPKSEICLESWPCIQHQSVLVGRTLFERLGGFSTSYFILSDYEFFCRAKSKGARYKFYPNIYISIYNAEGVSASYASITTILYEAIQIQKYYFKGFSVLFALSMVTKAFVGLFDRNKRVSNLLRRCFLVKR